MNSEQLYKKAYSLHYEQSNFPEALKLYNVIINEYPNSNESRYAKNQIENINKMSDHEKSNATKKNIAKSPIILTTSHFLEGYEVTETLKIITAECVFGMNIFKDFFASVTDFFGGRSNSAQKVLRDARETCLSELQNEARSIEADAVIAVDLDYSEISGQGKSMLFLVASGTAVKVKKKLVNPPNEDIVQNQLDRSVNIKQ